MELPMSTRSAQQYYCSYEKWYGSKAPDNNTTNLRAFVTEPNRDTTHLFIWQQFRIIDFCADQLKRAPDEINYQEHLTVAATDPQLLDAVWPWPGQQRDEGDVVRMAMILQRWARTKSADFLDKVSIGTYVRETLKYRDPRALGFPPHTARVESVAEDDSIGSPSERTWPEESGRVALLGHSPDTKQPLPEDLSSSMLRHLPSLAVPQQPRHVDQPESGTTTSPAEKHEGVSSVPGSSPSPTPSAPAPGYRALDTTSTGSPPHRFNRSIPRAFQIPSSYAALPGLLPLPATERYPSPAPKQASLPLTSTPSTYRVNCGQTTPFHATTSPTTRERQSLQSPRQDPPSYRQNATIQQQRAAEAGIQSSIDDIVSKFRNMHP